MNKKAILAVSECLFVSGFASIVGSVVIWTRSQSSNRARGERLGLFIGLWAPTLFILSERLAREASQCPDSCGAVQKSDDDETMAAE